MVSCPPPIFVSVPPVPEMVPEWVMLSERLKVMFAPLPRETAVLLIVPVVPPEPTSKVPAETVVVPE